MSKWNELPYMKRCSLLLIIREMHIKTRYHLTQLEWTSLKCPQIINARKDEEEREPSYTVGENGNWCSHYRKKYGRRSQDGRGVGWGEHFLPHKFIKRAFKRRVNSAKQLLNAGRGHQAPRKSNPTLRKEVGKNIKDKKRDKRGRDGVPSREGSLKKREVSKHRETFSLLNLCRALEAQRAT